MTLFSDILKELRGMFLADARLSLSVLALVAVVSGLIEADLVPKLVNLVVHALSCITDLATDITVHSSHDVCPSGCLGCDRLHWVDSGRPFEHPNCV